MCICYTCITCVKLHVCAIQLYMNAGVMHLQYTCSTYVIHKKTPHALHVAQWVMCMKVFHELDWYYNYETPA